MRYVDTIIASLVIQSWLSRLYEFFFLHHSAMDIYCHLAANRVYGVEVEIPALRRALI
jgi:hypothetical protein